MFKLHSMHVNCYCSRSANNEPSNSQQRFSHIYGIKRVILCDSLPLYECGHLQQNFHSFYFVNYSLFFSVRCINKIDLFFKPYIFAGCSLYQTKWSYRHYFKCGRQFPFKCLSVPSLEKIPGPRISLFSEFRSIFLEIEIHFVFASTCFACIGAYSCF